MSNIFALDIETSGLNPFTDRILCIGIWSPNESKCFSSLQEFTEWVNVRKPRLVTHAGSFDINFLRRAGCNISDNWFADTRSYCSILVPRPVDSQTGEPSLGLEFLSKVCLNLPDYKLDRTRMADYDWDTLSQYNLEDCRRTYGLFEYCLNKFDAEDFDFVESWLMPATKLCAELEYNGMLIDKKGLDEYALLEGGRREVTLHQLNELTKVEREEWYALQIEELSREYREMAIKALVKAKDKKKCENRYRDLFEKAKTKLEHFNWNSQKQLVWLLGEKYGLDLHSEREDKITTNEAMLRSHEQHPVVSKLLDYRETEKMVTTCIPALRDNIQPDGRVHGRYNIGGTITGRLSSSKPNLQQIPRGPIRGYIIPPEGMKFISSDLGQIEPRLIAHASEDQTLINTFKDGLDIYSVLGSKLFNLPFEGFKDNYPDHRQCAKTLALACFYGVGANKFKEQLFKDLQIVLNYNEARKQINEFMHQFPAVARFKSRLERSLMNQKKARNLLGRPISIPSNEDLRKSLNLYIQGSASDLLLRAIFSFINKGLEEAGIDYEACMVIHDQYVVSIDQTKIEQATEIIKEGMTTKIANDLNLLVPLKTDIIVSERWVK